MSKTAQQYLALAEAALDSEDLAGHEKYLSLAKAADEQAKAVKSFTLPTSDPVRLPLLADDKGAIAKPEDAVKSWAYKQVYIKKYGTPAAEFDAIANELYGDAGGYYAVSAMKHADFRRYLRTGQGDPRLARTLLLSQDQIAEAVIIGNTMGEIKATMVEATDTLGGYLVPEDYQQGEIISRLPGLTVVRPLATVRQTTRDAYSVAVRTGGDSRYVGNVRVTPVDESPTGTEANTNATFGKMTIPIHTLLADVSISRSVLEDAAVDLGSELAEEFGTARAIKEDEYYLIGSGVGVPTGILKNATTGGPSDANMITVVSGDAATLQGGDATKGLVSVPYGLQAQYRQNGAVWIMNKATLATTRTLKDGMGRYLWADNNNLLAGGQSDKLLGYTVKESEALGNIAANAYPIIFGDLKGYRIVDRVGMSIERYTD